MKDARKGFTLLEVILVMAILALMTGYLAVNFVGTTRKERLNGSAQRLRQALLAAKANAQSGKKDCATCGGAGGLCGPTQGDSPLQGWRVVLVLNPTPTPDAYRIEGVCSPVPYPTGTFTLFPPGVIEEKLPAGIDISVSGNSGNNNPILFRPLGGGIYPELAPSGLINIDVRNGVDPGWRLTIDGAGAIELFGL